MPSNLAGSSGDVQKRQFYLQGTDLSAVSNPFHKPTLPVAPVSPAAPTWPGTLNAAERAEVQKYLLQPNDQTLNSLTLRAAIAKAKEFNTYNADPAIVAWRAAVFDADWAQRVLNKSDALINNEGTTSSSAVATGIGASPPPASQPPGTNTP